MFVMLRFQTWPSAVKKIVDCMVTQQAFASEVNRIGFKIGITDIGSTSALKCEFFVTSLYSTGANLKSIKANDNVNNHLISLPFDIIPILVNGDIQ